MLRNRRWIFASAVALLLPAYVACSSDSDDGSPSSSDGGSPGAGGDGLGGADGTGATSSGTGATSTGTGGDAGGGSTLPGFDLERTLVTFDDVPSRAITCSGAANGSAQIGKVWVAQTHVMEPTASSFTTNDDGATLVAEAQLPKFRLVTHRPALLKVDVTGTGAAPEVKVVASKDGDEVGSLCLTGPATLPGSAPASPSFGDSFTVSLPADWIRPGLSLAITAGGATKNVPAGDLRVAGGLEHTIVEVPLLLFGNEAPILQEPRFAEELLAGTPVSKISWERFPVDVRLDKVILEDGSLMETPDEPLPDSFDLIRLAIDMANVLSDANGMGREAKFYGSLDRDQGGGLGGGNAAGGDASPGIFHHELGHTYGLPHLGDWYADLKYPFNKGSNAGGGSVGPYWAYDQLSETFLTPFTSGTAEKQDPMQGGSGDQQDGRQTMFFSTFSAQAITDHFQDRIFFDEASGKYRQYDEASGDYVDVSNDEVDVYDGLPIERDVPVYTVHGTFWLNHPEAGTIQPVLHYRGNLKKQLEVSDQATLDWLADNANEVCYWGCDYAVRATFEDGSQRTFAIHLDTKDYMRRWGINIPADKPLKKVEAFYRKMWNRWGEEAAPEHVSQTTAATYLDGYTAFATREL